MQYEAGVARDGGGTATVAITHPDGRKRFIFFERGKAIGADLTARPTAASTSRPPGRATCT